MGSYCFDLTQRCSIELQSFNSSHRCSIELHQSNSSQRSSIEFHQTNSSQRCWIELHQSKLYHCTSSQRCSWTFITQTGSPWKPNEAWSLWLNPKVFNGAISLWLVLKMFGGASSSLSRSSGHQKGAYCSFITATHTNAPNCLQWWFRFTDAEVLLLLTHSSSPGQHILFL